FIQKAALMHIKAPSGRQIRGCHGEHRAKTVVAKRKPSRRPVIDPEQTVGTPQIRCAVVATAAMNPACSHQEGSLMTLTRACADIRSVLTNPRKWYGTESAHCCRSAWQRCLQRIATASDPARPYLTGVNAVPPPWRLNSARATAP